MASSPVSRVVYNGKRSGGPRSPGAGSEIFTPAHEENVRFIYEAWQCVERDLRSQMGSERGLVEEYVEKMPNPSLKGEGGAGHPPPAPAGGKAGPRKPVRAGRGLRCGLCCQSLSCLLCSV
ncbi:mapk-regulated corepressor-interacting protein 1 isoform X1 [Grus americana]|uniref:mapk-regulated corepressor-interacting protein 1 isoform X1 n=1 Tax=Grus americana TaxID=9117 RepID=UPI00240858B3|nr:mapk-regulated corepressor-interacting protein 1 isoform X1 [Grus americana]